MTASTTVKDPVCGMDVNAAAAAGQSVYDGKTFAFCSSRCKKKFDAGPERYTESLAGAPKADDACCG